MDKERVTAWLDKQIELVDALTENRFLEDESGNLLSENICNIAYDCGRKIHLNSTLRGTRKIPEIIGVELLKERIDYSDGTSCIQNMFLYNDHYFFWLERA